MTTDWRECEAAVLRRFEAPDLTTEAVEAHGNSLFLHQPPLNPADFPPALAEALRKAYVSPKRLAANRANAKKSTGPKTEEGKKSSRLNASRHHITGQVPILPDAQRFAAHSYIDPIIAQLTPVAAEEAAIASDIATSHWRLNRVRAAHPRVFLTNLRFQRIHSAKHQLARYLHVVE